MSLNALVLGIVSGVICGVCRFNEIKAPEVYFVIGVITGALIQIVT